MCKTVLALTVGVSRKEKTITIEDDNDKREMNATIIPKEKEFQKKNRYP